MFTKCQNTSHKWAFWAQPFRKWKVSLKSQSKRVFPHSNETYSSNTQGNHIYFYWFFKFYFSPFFLKIMFCFLSPQWYSVRWQPHCSSLHVQPPLFNFRWKHSLQERVTRNTFRIFVDHFTFSLKAYNFGTWFYNRGILRKLFYLRYLFYGNQNMNLSATNFWRQPSQCIWSNISNWLIDTRI